MPKAIPDIPAALEMQHLDQWSQALGISDITADAVIGKAPGSFRKYVEGVNQMKHPDFVTLQNYLRIRAEALRK